MPDKIFSCDFAPNPFSSATFPASQAAFSSPMLSTPKASRNALIFFPPNPGTSSISNKPAGTERRNFSRYSNLPSRQSAVTFSVKAAPMPCTSSKVPSSNRSSNFSRLSNVRAPA